MVMRNSEVLVGFGFLIAYFLAILIIVVTTPT